MCERQWAKIHKLYMGDKGGQMEGGEGVPTLTGPLSVSSERRESYNIVPG